MIFDILCQIWGMQGSLARDRTHALDPEGWLLTQFLAPSLGLNMREHGERADCCSQDHELLRVCTSDVLGIRRPLSVRSRASGIIDSPDCGQFTRCLHPTTRLWLLSSDWFLVQSEPD